MMPQVLFGLVAGVVLGGIAAFFLAGARGPDNTREAQTSAGQAIRDAETRAKEIVLGAKEEAHHIRTTAEDEARTRQGEVLAMEHKTQQREDLFVRRLEELEG